MNDKQTQSNIQKIQKQGKSYQRSSKPRNYQSAYSNRLGGLIYHPQLIEQHKKMIQQKMSLVTFTRKSVQYTGLSLLFLHILGNRLKVTKLTGLFIIIPPVLSYLIKLGGYLYVDNYAQRVGLYKIYKISTL